MVETPVPASAIQNGVVCSVRRVVIHLAESYPRKDLFARILGRLRALAVRCPASG
jgi:hypothetical protein